MSVFNPPTYLTMPSVGIDISDETIRFVLLKKTQQAYSIPTYTEVHVPKGVIEKGRIIQTQPLIELLRSVQKKYGFTTARISLPEEHIYLFTLTIPGVTPNEIRTAILFQIEEHVPLKKEEVMFDYEVLHHSEGSVFVQVAVIALVIATEYSDVFTTAGYMPLSLELEAQALARAVIPNNDTGTYMIIDFGSMRTGISFVSNGVVRLTSTVEVGGNTVSAALQKNFGISFEEAEMLKKRSGLVKRKDTIDTFNVLLNTISILRDEINTHFIFWHTHNTPQGEKNPPIEKIILVGGNAHLVGLPEYLSVSLHVPVVLGNVWVNIFDIRHTIPPIPFAESVTYGTALGLALAHYD